MERESGVHTVPVDGTRWANRVDGVVVSRHRRRVEAVIAGEAMAESLGLEHSVHGEHSHDGDAGSLPTASAGDDTR